MEDSILAFVHQNYHNCLKQILVREVISNVVSHVIRIDPTVDNPDIQVTITISMH